jgi:hypothetical protein
MSAAFRASRPLLTSGQTTARSRWIRPMTTTSFESKSCLSSPLQELRSHHSQRRAPCGFGRACSGLILDPPIRCCSQLRFLSIPSTNLASTHHGLVNHVRFTLISANRERIATVITPSIPSSPTPRSMNMEADKTVSSSAAPTSLVLTSRATLSGTSTSNSRSASTSPPTPQSSAAASSSSPYTNSTNTTRSFRFCLPHARSRIWSSPRRSQPCRNKLG